jgi:CDGSH-type Zn-finger protein
MSTTLKDRPLRVEASPVTCSGNGRAAGRTDTSWPCHCAASQDTPYGDGTGQRIGFTA